MDEQLLRLVEKTRLFLFDMDGTLYLGNRLFSFTSELLTEIRKKGKNYLFITNNSSKGVPDYVKKMERLGVPAVFDDFLTSSQATVYYFLLHMPHEVIYVGGTESLKEELRSAGLQVTEDADQATCILMGFDIELTFRKLDDICRTLTVRDVRYFATHPDMTCPTEYGFVPDCGSVCDMVFNATGKRPVVIGKPTALMPQLAMERMGTQKDETTVVGDSLFTDIPCGLAAGIHSIAVLTGNCTKESIAASVCHPDLVLNDCGQILSVLKQIK